VAASKAKRDEASRLLRNIIDPTFNFDGYNQATYTIRDGIFANFDLLSISIQAQRIPTMSAIFLIFPLCMLCLALAMVLHSEVGNQQRLSVPMTVMTGTMAFSYVISNQCPPVSYTTRMHLMIFQTYIFAVIILLLNYFLWCVDYARKELSKNEAKNKTLLADADAISKKIKKTAPQKVEIVSADKPKETPSAPAPVPASGEDMSDLVQMLEESTAPGDAKDDVRVDVKANQVAPEGADKPAPAKSEKTGAFPDGEGGFKDIKDLLESDMVKTFKKLKYACSCSFSHLPSTRFVCHMSNSLSCMHSF
jgi:hypothetical protein